MTRLDELSEFCALLLVEHGAHVLAYLKQVNVPFAAHEEGSIDQHDCEENHE